MRHSIKPRALADMATVHAEGAERFGDAAADDYVAGMIRAFALLEEFPRAARLRPELKPPVRVYCYRSHMILYDLGPGDRVIVLRVAHARSDWINDQP